VTKKEMAKIMAILAAAYHNFMVDELKVEVWHSMLGDLNYEVVQIAIKKSILESPFAPSIAEVRKAAIELKNPHLLSSAEAWEEVNQALDRYGYYDQARAMESMSPLTARVVRAIGFSRFCLSNNLSVERGHFIRLYEELAKQEQSKLLLPERIKEQIKQIGVPRIAEKNKLPNGTGDR
jgi:hypothetical protein